MSQPQENPIEIAYWVLKAQDHEASLDDVFALLVASNQFTMTNLNAWLIVKREEIAAAKRMIENTQSLESTVSL